MIVEDKVVVVSGVGAGLGSEVARLALRDGARVVSAARNAEKLEGIAAELDPSGERILAQPTDIMQVDACQGLMKAAMDRFGSLDALVNVAALDTLFGTLESTSAADWRAALDTNVVGTAQVVSAAAGVMKATGGGSVVLVGSQAMWKPPPAHQIAYAASKGALVSAMYHMVEELGPDKIRVNMVIPTWMWGPPVQIYVKMRAKQEGRSEAEVLDDITSNMALREMPADEDVAEAIVFFCSDRARMITGETLLVNAGEVLR
jgi:NAD(P)-dependent dehydrogenase (short-subunit alcohol dehydrogenase family)